MAKFSPWVYKSLETQHGRLVEFLITTNPMDVFLGSIAALVTAGLMALALLGD